jgi:phosphoglycolate phosphatase-like HAD superfamily hydrolase
MFLNKRNWFAFDWDGTLVDCRERQVAVLSDVIPRVSRASLDLGAWWQRKTEGMTTHQSLVAGGMTPADASAVANLWVAEVEDERWLELDMVYPQAQAALGSVVAHGFLPVVLTARKRSEGVRSEILKSSIGRLVEETWVVDPVDAADHKAHLLLQNKVNVFIGDSESDFFAARAANAIFGGISSGQRSATYLTSAGVPRIFSDVLGAVTALIPLLLQSNEALR